MAKLLTVQQQNRLLSGTFRNWLDEEVLSFGSEGNYTRRVIVEVTGTPCTAAAARLNRICKDFNITSVERLFKIGIDGLTACAGLGERSALIAAFVLLDHGYDVDDWLQRRARGTHTWLGSVAESKRRTRKRQHRAA